MRKVDAVYEGGVLRPTEKLLLEEHQLVTVILVDDETAEQDIQFEPKHCFEPLANRSIKRETVRGRPVENSGIIGRRLRCGTERALGARVLH
jgi:predicted DNA-binding antitoxin AbrB/MazE fold protein